MANWLSRAAGERPRNAGSVQLMVHGVGAGGVGWGCVSGARITIGNLPEAPCCCTTWVNSCAINGQAAGERGEGSRLLKTM